MKNLFDYLDHAEKETFQRYLEVLKFKEDEVILNEGAKNNSLYIIKKGLVRVQKKVEGKNLILDDLKEGETIGEITFLEEGKSSASCIAVLNSELYAISRKDFDEFSVQYPFISTKLLLGIALKLKERIVKTNETLATYFNISQNLIENEQFRRFYSFCFK